MLKKKFLGVLCSIALIMTLVPATVAAAADPITTDVVIHKLVVAAGTAEAAHDGEEIDELTGNLAGATPLAGVTFRYWSIADTATAAQLAQLLGLETVAAVEAWMAINTGILTAGGTTGATDAQGVTGVFIPTGLLPSPPPCGWSTGFITTPRTVGLTPMCRLRPALPSAINSWSMLPICPIVAQQFSGTLRISPLGILRIAYPPSRPMRRA